MQYVSKKGKYSSMSLSVQSHVFEQKSVQERHNLLQMAYWLTTHKRKIKTVIKERILPVSALYRDSEEQLKRFVTVALLD